MTLRLRVGLQTAYSAAETLEPFRFAVAHQFDAFEWFADQHGEAGWDFPDLDQGMRRQLRQTGAEAGLAFTVHAPWQASPLTDDGQRRLAESVDFACDVGARLVNLHLDPGQSAAAFVAALSDLASAAARAGVCLALENTPETEPEYCNEVFDALRRSPWAVRRAGFCIDVGHANLCLSTRSNYLQYIDRLHPELPVVHVHLHENYGDCDSHLVVFTGPSRDDDRGIRQLLGRLSRRGFDGVMILEQWPDPPTLLLQARDRLRELAVDLRPASSPPARRVSNGSGTAVPEFALRVAQMSAAATSWRRRLEWVRDVLREPGLAGDEDRLTYLAIYLRFLGTGAVPCVEDGGHHRPGRHAEAALDIERTLLGLRAPAVRSLVRGILRWLPSHDSAFRTSEPLTRIRDIAHRNDIGQELKREIKHTLQNKLHRSAGPEDLETSRRILERITAPGAGHPAPFVEQFRIFHAELEEFFNARSVEADLAALEVADRPSLQTAIDELLALRRQGSHSPDALDRQLGLVLDVRGALQLAFGALGDAHAQRMRIADIKLEELGFVLLSERAGQLEGGAEALRWDAVLGDLGVAVRSLALGGVLEEDCAAVARELEHWGERTDLADRDWLLGVRATLDRARSLTARHADAVLARFGPRVERLGSLLGVDAPRLRSFCEGGIRGGIAFQLSRLATFALRRIRTELGLEPWDAVVVAVATGRLLELDRLDALPDGDEPCVVMLGRAEGDEEIPARVRGIVLAHDLPHLSHLGVRARQDQVAFATLQDPPRWQRWAERRGSRVRLSVTASALELGPATTDEGGAVVADALRLPPAKPVQEWTVVRLVEADPERCGAKAANASRLLELSESLDAPFLVPWGCVLPFGTLELCLGLEPALSNEYESLLRRVTGSEASDLHELLGRLRDVICRAGVPEHLLVALIGELGDDAPLFVRSSASGEDLPGFSAAGLYDSVGGVSGLQLLEAIRTVWASLWSRRAVLARRRAGIAPSGAHMAVLIQAAVRADLSFVLHTQNPFDDDPDEAYAELAVGLGETLASALLPGAPYRVAFNRRTGRSRWMAFASYDRARVMSERGRVVSRVIDYTRSELSTERGAREQLVSRLQRVADFVHEAFGGAQDVEGAIGGDTLYLLQARPQAGVRP